MRARLLFALRLLGTSALLVLFARWVEWSAVGAALAGARPGWFAFAVLTYAAGQLGNGFAWRGLLRAAGVEVGVGEMVRHDLASVFWSTVVPGGVAGEVVKGVRIARARGDGPTVALGIVSARLVGGASAGLLALVLLPFSRAGEVAGPLAALVLAAPVLAGLGGLLLLRLAGPRLPAGLHRGRPPGAPALARAAVATLGTHLAFAASTAACFAAVGEPVDLTDGAWISVVTSLAEVLPVSLGGFGVREVVLTSLGAGLVPAGAAAGAALLMSAAVLLTVILGGLSELTRGREPGSGRET